jgi:hypothetical protein
MEWSTEVVLFFIFKIEKSVNGTDEIKEGLGIKSWFYSRSLFTILRS